MPGLGSPGLGFRIEKRFRERSPAGTWDLCFVFQYPIAVLTCELVNLPYTHE